jgi:hypothetical protein
MRDTHRPIACVTNSAAAAPAYRAVNHSPSRNNGSPSVASAVKPSSEPQHSGVLVQQRQQQHHAPPTALAAHIQAASCK